ncbi:claspin [Epinephelus fuscoguttatus]|uniref:claspin n=1 Tax=Epinephelus fuscoguttatus TaxID=293821 RepID=UPI0020D1D369|nr:claspin [Epinephelus fuscoguttatus]
MSEGQRDNTEEGLRMDEDSPMISRVERTFWTVWSYITGAVNRFFRPEPTNVTSNDPNSIQDLAVDSEPANCGHAEGDTSGAGVDEEKPVATAALLSSSRPLVAWEICTTEINLEPDEESVPCETQLSRGSESEASEEGEGTREEQLGRAGNDDAGLFFAQDDKREEDGDEKLHTRRQDVMSENGETEEHANIRSLKTTGDAVSEDMEESRGGAEDSERAVTLDETIQLKEAEDKMQHEDEQDLQAEDSELKPCLTADLTAVEEDNMHVEESKMQRNKADTAVMHEEGGNTDGVPQLGSESESDEGARQVEHQLSACEESSDDHRDFKEDPGFSPLLVELQMTYDKSSTVSEDELTAVEQQHVMARRSESDEVEDTKEETDGSALDVSEAANNQTMDEAPEQEDNIKTLAGVIISEHVTYREEAMQHSPEQEDDIKTVTEDILAEHVTCSEEVMQNAPQMEEEIKTVTEDIITERVMSSGGFVQNALEREDNIETVTDDTLTEHVTRSEEFVQYLLEQEDDSLTEHVTDSREFVQNAPELEEEIKTVTEDIITELLISSCEFVQNALEQEDDIETVTEDILTEHVTCSEEVTQNAPEQEDNILTEHVTCSEEVTQNAPEQEDDILTEHVTCSEDVTQNAPEQEDGILTEHVIGSGEFVQNALELEEEIKTVTEDIITELLISSCEFVQNALEQEDDIETVTEDILTEQVTCSEEVTQNAPEQEDVILTEHVTCSDEFVQNAPEQEDAIETLKEDTLTEHVKCSEEVTQNAPEQEDDIKTVTEGDTFTEHVTRSEEVTQNASEQEDHILSEHVTCSEEVMQNFPEQDDDIKTDTEANILTEHVTCSDKFMQNAPEQEDSIKTVTEDIIIEHVTCSEEFVQHAPEQEDDIITEHVTHGDEIMQNTPEQEDDILTEHVICSEEVTHHSPEQEGDIETLTADVLTERVTCSDDIMQNAPEQEDDIEAVTEDDILTEHVTHSEEFMQNAESELHTADFADVEQEDVAEDTEVQTKSREADDVETESHGSLIDTNSDITTHTSADESYFAQVEEESLSSEAVNKESDMEIACIATSVMDKPDGETGQEMSREFKNIPQSMCEGRVVVSEELNSPTCEETREGVPEYNNEPDENTTQGFLEDEGYEEIQGSPLPEEVESKEPESLQNSGWSAGADCLLVREHMGEEQGVKNSFGLVVEDHAEILRLADAGMPQETETPLVETVIQGSGHLVEVEDRELLVDSMKMGIEEETEKESESDVESTNKDDKATEEPQDGTEELSVDLEKDEGLCDPKVAVAAGVGWETTGALAAQEVLEDDTFPEAEVQKMTETSYFHGLVDVMNSEQQLTSSLLDDITQSEFLKHSDETESVLLEDVEIQDAGYAVEMEAAADEMQGRNEMEIFHLQATEMAELELSGPAESLETKNQLSDEVLEISNEEMLPEAPGESMTAQSEPQDLILISTEDTTKHVTESGRSHAEETVSSISGHADVIDEEILDLWIQTASSEDNDGIQQQEGPEPGQQTEPSNEEQGEMSSAQTEKDEEQLVDLVSDTEMSSSTVESGFLDQSLGEWGTQSNETQQPKSTSTESFQGIHEMLADISESSTQHSDFLMEETAETDLKQDESITATRFHPDSGVTSPEKEDLNQESDKSQEETEEERAEAVETETGSQKEIDAEEAELAEKTDWKDTEEADVQSDKAETEDKPLEMSDSPDEIKHTESERSGSSSEASLEEGVVLTESGSQDDTCTESERLSMLPSLDEPQPRQSEDIAESEAGAEVAEQLTTKSEDEMEVDTFVLDFTVQRSRIAVKNPRVRPPKDPRSLLHMPSLDPTPSVPQPAKVPIGVPLGGMGIGIKLPGLGAGFPVLKKTQRVVRDENKPETPSEETKPEEKSDTPKQDEAPQRPKWMPPKHPGFGNPLMSELKSKLKKTTKE